MPRSRVSVLSWVIAIAFVIGTVLSYVDRLDLWAAPPELPAGASIVDHVLASAGYLQAIWPIFFGTNLAFAIGFTAAAAFAAAVASAVGGRAGLPVFASLLVVGGVIGAVASLITVGAGSAHVFQPYCDCASKDTEIIGQVAALGVFQEISDWMNRFAAVVVAVALFLFARDARPALSDALRTWTWITGLGLIATAIVTVIGPSLDPLPDLLQTLVIAVVVPVWAVWLARTVERTGNAGIEAPTA